MIPKQRPTRALVAASELAAVLVAMGVVLRSAGSLPGETVTVQTYVPLLVAAGAVCVAGIARGRRPTVAWLAAVFAGAVAALEVLGIVRFVLPYAPRSWPILVVPAEIGLVGAAVIAVAYAARARPTRRRWVSMGVPVFALIALGMVVAGAVWEVARASAAVADPPPGPWRPVAAGLISASVVGAVLVGAARDLTGPVTRAWGRLEVARRADAGVGEGEGARRRDFIGFFWDELWPSAVETRRLAIEQERTRLAADLHALVLPDLRRAVAAAEASIGAADPVSVRIRSALADVEQLMHGRQSVVLEQFGLAAALEWLAESTEERGSVRVAIDMDGDLEPGMVPLATQRSAFRIALLALDNVVRHSGASTATVALTVDAVGVRLAIVDDGMGLDARRGSTERPGRGLVDMQTEAGASGGRLTVSSSSAGTRVLGVWPGPAVMPGVADAGEPAIQPASTATGLTSPGA